MTPIFRKLNLTAHITFSIGWLGAVASFLVLSIAGLSSQNAEIVRGAYLSMNLIGEFIIVPLSLAALLTGLVQSLGTSWGLFRYYWIFVKFVMAIGATLLLLQHQFRGVARAAKRVSESSAGTLPDVGPLGMQFVAEAAFAVIVLLIASSLSVHKPWGMTPYGLRKSQPFRRGSNETADAALPSGLKILAGALALLLVAFAALHHAGPHHGH